MRNEKEQIKKPETIAPLPKVDLDDIIVAALEDEQSRQTVEWLQATQDRMPSREELDEYKLTELNYLTLQTDGVATLRSFPGGMAGALANEILKKDILRLHETTNGKTPIEVLAMMHGSLAPKIGNDGDTCCGDKAFHQHHLYQKGNDEIHNGTSCGVAGGNLNLVPAASLNTREQADFNIQALKAWAAENNIAISVTAIEALIVNPNSAKPMMRIYRETPLESEDINNPCTYPTEELLSMDAFNDYLRIRMEAGKPITGIACSDRRQGTMQPHKSIEPLDLNSLSQQIKLGPLDRLFKTNPIRYDWAALEHTERKIVPIIGNDLEMQQIALYSLKHPGTILRGINQQGNFLSDSADFIINVPGDFIDEFGEQVAIGLRNLISRVDTDVYIKGHGVPGVRHFEMRDGKPVEVTTAAGLQVVIPRGSTGEMIHEHIRPGRVIVDLGTPRTETNLGHTVELQEQTNIIRPIHISKAIADFTNNHPIINPFTVRQPGRSIDDIFPNSSVS